MRIRAFASSLVAFGLLAGLASAQQPMGNSGARNRKASAPKAKFVPIHELEKSAGFAVRQLPTDRYRLMASEQCDFPAGFAGLKAPHRVIMLTYGVNKGGIVRFYQTKTIPGMSMETFMKELAKAGSFHDVSRRPGWTVAVVPSKGVSYIPTSGDKALVADAVKILKSS